jgi:hypothetical protein
MTNGNDTIKFRIERLEDCQGKIEERLDTIMENHLPHIKSDLESLKTRISVLTAINVGAVIVGVLIAKYL